MNAMQRAGLALALAAPFGARADTAADLQALRNEIATMRADYESRIQTLEARLKAAESAQASAQVAPPGAATPPIAAPAAVAASASGGGFNPALSLILSGGYTRTSRDPADYRIRGIPLPPGAELGPGTRGFNLAESELGTSASIDPWFSGAAHIAIHPDDSVSVEEAYVQTTSLGRGLTLKGGRFFSSIGYLNSQHAHVWDFADAPLAYQALLGTQFGDDGVQLAWIAPTDRLLDIRLELGRGRSFPGTNTSRNGPGMAALSVHTGDDIGLSHSWRAGLSLLHARATDQELLAVDPAGSPASASFSGRTRVLIADAVWKWAPNGNATRTHFKLQGEYLRGTRSGLLTADPAGVASTDGYRAVQSGWYLQAVYQFMPRWRAGLRTERVDGGSPGLGANAPLLAGNESVARKHSAMLEWNPSEFSRLRLQLARDMARPGAPDHQLWLQYQMSLGAHGAHGF